MYVLNVINYEAGDGYYVSTFDCYESFEQAAFAMNALWSKFVDGRYKTPEERAWAEEHQWFAIHDDAAYVADEFDDCTRWCICDTKKRFQTFHFEEAYRESNDYVE